ncbi:MAG: hypothetical protein L0170_03635 [Acidobacteria bacterium]|nr:hypothetical protein [Acidobacteriota bacterium]
MDEKIEKALRALAGSAGGPFRTIAYAGRKGAEVDLELRLRALAGKEGLSADHLEIFVEAEQPRSASSPRPLWKTEVLGRFEAATRQGKRPKKGAVPSAEIGRGAPTRAKERLSALSASLPDLLRKVDRTLGGIPAGGANPELPSETPAPVGMNPEQEGPDPDPGTPLLLVPRLEELGSSAESVAQTVRLLVTWGVHVVVHEDGLDSRTREGRAIARAALRLGELRSVRARLEATRDIQERRAGLRVYGPVPFGFRREGSELRPIEEQLGAVRRIRELARLEQTPVTIAVTLNREKHRWKDGSLWSWRRVAQIRKNSIYDQVLAGTPE